MQDCGLEENIINDFKDGISHGILVGNLTYALAKRLGMSEDDDSMTITIDAPNN